MGAHESVVRATIADLAPVERRGAAYGLFHSAYGVCWFAGSALMGVLRDVSPFAMAACSIAAQGLAAVIVLRLRRAGEAA
jgi:hypothetical protein